MLRNVAAKRQAELIKDAVAKAGLRGMSHSEVLELVARLNGAESWNAFLKERDAGRNHRLSQRVKQWLTPLAQRLGLLQVLAECAPLAHRPRGRGFVEGLYQLMVEAGGHGTTEREVLEAVRRRLVELRTAATELEDAVSKAMGHNRTLPVPEEQAQYKLRLLMLDDEEPGYLLVDNQEVKLPFELLDQIARHGVVTRATVDYPRADRYGTPSEATDTGCREWLWQQGFAVAPDFEAHGRDTGDDSMSFCTMDIHLPDDLARQVRALD